MKRIFAALVCLTLTFASVADELHDALDVAIIDAERLDRETLGHKVLFGAEITGSILLLAGAGAAIDPATEQFTPGSYIAMAFSAVCIGLALWELPRIRHARSNAEHAWSVVNRTHNAITARDTMERVSRFTTEEQSAIARHQIFIGMSEAAMLESWGQPISINRTVTRTTEDKQFVYPNHVYVYTENGVVTGWQD